MSNVIQVHPTVYMGSIEYSRGGQFLGTQRSPFLSRIIMSGQHDLPLGELQGVIDGELILKSITGNGIVKWHQTISQMEVIP